MGGKVVVDEYVVGGKEKEKVGRSYHSREKKIAMAVELSEENKVKRIYNQILNDFSAASMGELFTKPIDKENAKVLTDQWKAYTKLAKEMSYTIEQVNSKENSSSRFFEIHTMIHQVKTTLRTIYAWVHKKYMQRYLDEVAFRINRSMHKNTIVHKLMERMVRGQPLAWKQVYVPN